jgi:hypothetical protein
VLISPFINFWKSCLIIALCKIAAATPHTLGFLIHPFQSSFSNAPRNCPYWGKFVNPLETPAIISFLNIVRHKSHRSLHFLAYHFLGRIVITLKIKIILCQILSFRIFNRCLVNDICSSFRLRCLSSLFCQVESHYHRKRFSHPKISP